MTQAVRFLIIFSALGLGMWTVVQRPSDVALPGDVRQVEAASRLSASLALPGPVVRPLLDSSEPRSLVVNRPLRLGYYFPQDQTSLDSLRRNIRHLDIVAPHTLTIDATGTLETYRTPEASAFLRTTNAIVLPSVMLTSKYAGTQIVRDPDVFSQAVSQLTDAAMPWDGLALDFEGMDPADRPYLSAFINTLGSALHERGKYYAVALPAKTSDVKTGWSGSYDYAAIKDAADLYLVMAYGFTTSSSATPGSSAPLPWMDSAMAYAVSEIAADRLILGIPFYGYDWNVTAGPPARALRYRDTKELLARTGATPTIDRASASATFSYVDEGERHEVWYEDDRSIAPKLNLVRKYGLRGVGAWRLGQEDPSAWVVWEQMLAVPSFTTSARLP